MKQLSGAACGSQTPIQLITSGASTDSTPVWLKSEVVFELCGPRCFHASLLVIDDSDSVQAAKNEHKSVHNLN